MKEENPRKLPFNLYNRLLSALSRNTYTEIVWEKEIGMKSKLYE